MKKVKKVKKVKKNEKLITNNEKNNGRSRKRLQTALSRYKKARSASKYRAKRRGSPAVCRIFQREPIIFFLV